MPIGVRMAIRFFLMLTNMCPLTAHHFPYECIQEGGTLLRLAVDEDYHFGLKSLLENKANTEILDGVRG